MKTTKLKDKIDAHCRQVLREAAEFVSKPTFPPEDDFTEIVDPASYLTGYPQKGNITFQESLATGQTLKKLLSYMSQRANNANSNISKQTIIELIVEASKIYANIIINEPSKEDKKNDQN